MPDRYPTLCSGTVLPQGERNRGIPYPNFFPTYIRGTIRVAVFVDVTSAFCGTVAVVSTRDSGERPLLIAFGLVFWDGIHVSFPFLYPFLFLFYARLLCRVLID